MHFKTLAFFIVYVVINEVDAQADCGRISLTYVKTEDAVNAKLQFFPNVELSKYRWVHFFNRTKPDFNFLKAVIINKSKYDYLYEDYVLTIKELQTSDEGIYNVECETQNGYHTFSENRLVITKPYISKTSSEATSVSMTTSSKKYERQSTTISIFNTTTWKRATTDGNEKYTGYRNPSSKIDHQEYTENTKVPESTFDGMSGSVSPTATNSFGPPKSVLNDTDMFGSSTEVNGVLKMIAAITGGCLFIVVIISVTIACRRKTNTNYRTERDDEPQKKATHLTTINLDTNEETGYSEIGQVGDKRLASDVKLQTFVSPLYEVPSNKVTSVENVYDKLDDEFIKVGNEIGIGLDSVTKHKRNERKECVEYETLSKKDEHMYNMIDDTRTSKTLTGIENKRSHCRPDSTTYEIVVQNIVYDSVIN